MRAHKSLSIQDLSAGAATFDLPGSEKRWHVFIRRCPAVSIQPIWLINSWLKLKDHLLLFTSCLLRCRLVRTNSSCTQTKTFSLQNHFKGSSLVLRFLIRFSPGRYTHYLSPSLWPQLMQPRTNGGTRTLCDLGPSTGWLTAKV